MPRPLIVCLVWVTLVAAEPGREVALGGGRTGLEQARPLVVPGCTTNLRVEGGQASLTIDKTAPERALAGVELPAPGDGSWAKAIEVTYRLEGLPGAAARWVLVVHEPDGEVWLSVGRPVEAAVGSARLNLTGLRLAAFADPGERQLDLRQPVRLWLGLALDGPARGTLNLLRAVYTDRPYRPTAPLVVPLGQAADWSLTKQDDAKGTITVVPEGEQGAPAVRLDFTAPGGAHRWILPSRSIPGEQTEGYATIRFRYKATIPAGMHLLFCVLERDGSQYIIDPPVPPAADWATFDWPLDKLKLGGWSNDENNKLDWTAGMTVMVGLHGTPNPGGEGRVLVSRIELLP